MSYILTKLTLTTMRKNRNRTLSTSVGIILSVFFMTVIVLLASSLSMSMVTAATNKYGSWHVMSKEFTGNMIDDMKTNKIIQDSAYIDSLGYMQISEPQNTNKPYIHIAETSKNITNFIICDIKEGRFPETDNEIVVTSQFLKSYPAFSMGSEIEIDIGQRLSNASNSVLEQNASYLGNDKEHIQASGNKKVYHIVGIVDRIPTIEYDFSPGYTFITFNTTTTYKNFSKTYLKLQNLPDSLDRVNDYLSSEKIIYNSELLSYLGVTGSENLQDMIFKIVVALIAIVGFSAFILINNSLVTASDERSKQFGVLLSIGMTRIQTILMYLLEVIIIGVISIIAGVSIGIGFVFSAFQWICKLIIQASYLDLALKIDLNILYLLMVALITFIILMVAAIINALRCIKGSVISKVKRNKEIKIRNQKSKNKSANVEWSIITSSFKRYNKKYRYALISLLLSVVLFVVAGSFESYANKYIEEMLPTVDYDIRVIVHQNDFNAIINDQYNTITQISEISNSGWISYASAGLVQLDGLEIDDNLKKYILSHDIDKLKINYAFISNEHFIDLCKRENKDSNDYFAKDGRVLMYDNLSYRIDGEICSFPLFQGNSATFPLCYMNKQQWDDYNTTGNLQGNYTNILLKADRVTKSNLQMELSTLKNSNGIFVIIPIDMLSEFSNDLPVEAEMYFSALDYKTAQNKIEQLSNESDWNIAVETIAERYEKEKNTYAMYDIFVVVFSIMVSLVSIINAFNAVYSNLMKRRREFAVLQSIGISEKGFNKLIVYECMFLCGVVTSAATVLSLLLSLLLSFSFPLTQYVYFVPLKHLLIATLCLIIVIFISMIKPATLIKKQNVIETIKGDTD